MSILNAVLGGASILGGLLGASKQAKAAKQAAAAQERAMQEQLRLQREQQEYARAQYQPYQEYGASELAQLRDPNASFMASPDYQFRLQGGLNAVTQNRATRGTLQSGATLKGLSNYGQDTAANEFGNWYNRKMQGVGIGQGAVGGLVNAGSQYANNAGNVYGNIGQNQAQLAYDKGNLQAGQFGMLSGAAQGAIGSPFVNSLNNRYFTKPVNNAFAGGFGGGIGGGIAGGMSSGLGGFYRG